MFEDTQNYYELLDIKPDASQNEIRQAYLRAKVAYGKGSAALYSLFDEQQTRSVLDKVEQAYLVLSNPEKRKEYDQVHGFISGTQAPIETTRPAVVRPNVTSSGSPDFAQQAASSLFGKHDQIDLGDSEPSTEFTRELPWQSSSRVAEESSPPRASNSTVVFSSPAFESRMGAVRRLDLIKPHAKDPTVETEIQNEAQFRGGFLRKVREYKGITVDELCEFTKISKTYINCIESEAFESLPAPVYLRGFIVQIAKALKLPHDKAAEGYMTYYRSVVRK